MIKLTYYEVYDDYSEDGRGGKVEIVGRFTDKSDADEYAKTHGNYGNQAQVKKREIVIYKTLKEKESENS